MLPKGATKLYFMHSSWMVIILFSMFSVFSPYSFRLVFRLSVFWLWIQFHLKRLNDTLKAFDDFKNRQQKSMNVFWCIYILKAYIFWKFIQYTILWSKTHWQRMLTKFPSDKLNVSKNALFLFLLFFFSRAPNHHSFTFNWSTGSSL